MPQFPERLRPGQLIREWANQLRDAVLAVLIGGNGIMLERRGQQVVMSADMNYLRERLRAAQAVPIPHHTFAVRVWRDGGTTDGDQSTQCDRTYNVRTLEATGPSTGGRELGTGMTPDKVRHTIGKMLVASTTGGGVVGLGYLDADGDFGLYDANETLDTGACS
jgi:hypothetical protein